MFGEDADEHEYRTREARQRALARVPVVKTKKRKILGRTQRRITAFAAPPVIATEPHPGPWNRPVDTEAQVIPKKRSVAWKIPIYQERLRRVELLLTRYAFMESRVRVDVKTTDIALKRMLAVLRKFAVKMEELQSMKSTLQVGYLVHLSECVAEL